MQVRVWWSDGMFANGCSSEIINGTITGNNYIANINIPS